ncbi:outer membrane beta-barrel protein [Acidocella sp.]|jgi:hypothetical protein|uniref:outer membrane beta-barrel protein n=1 Tax=Acidocella sp. TaxID=50710 RepID=UPI002F3EEC2E
MTTLRQRLLGAGLVVACPLIGIQAAHAMNGPSAIQIDGGPLGQLELSGGMDGYFYGMTGTGTSNSPNYGYLGDKAGGANLANGLIELQKTSGQLQFTIEVGANAPPPTLGLKPQQASVNGFSTGPLYMGYVTLAPNNSPFTLSAGQFASLEGYEGDIDWNNANIFSTMLFNVENTQSTGVEASFTKGPVAATVQFGDGYNTGVFNFLQAEATYTFNKNNALTVYYGGNLGATGVNAHTYAASPASYDQTSLSEAGAYFDNSQLFGAYYTFTAGNLTLVPEVQYQYSTANHRLAAASGTPGLDKYSSNFGAAVFSDYAFGSSPYSIGAWAEYWTSNGNNDWFISPGSSGEGISITPTWQYKDLFARLDGGALYLNHTRDDGESFGYGNSGRTPYQFSGLLEAGLLF